MIWILSGNGANQSRDLDQALVYMHMVHTCSCVVQRILYIHHEEDTIQDASMLDMFPYFYPYPNYAKIETWKQNLSK